MGIRLTWLGQSCFQLDDGSTVVITDPYHPQIGYPAHQQAADVVTISHGHHDHDWLGWIQGEPVVLRAAGEYSHGTMRARAIGCFHDEVRGAKRGPNLIFVIEMGGVRVAHLGDLGHELDDETAEAIGPLDVLLVPVGGFYTIDAAQADAVCESLQPKLIVPMHFNPEPDVRKVSIAPVDEFATLRGAAYAHSSTIRVDTGGPFAGTVVMDYLHE